uniref:Uncharacterized protein n=1 Tax=Anguilla anguilla TaxID=7936 RepID=A0A0E9QZ07_ANGAN
MISGGWYGWSGSPLLSVGPSSFGLSSGGEKERSSGCFQATSTILSTPLLSSFTFSKWCCCCIHCRNFESFL